ncbi:MAG: YicC family protein [Clostridia bacterium]|nr:YicC family protein [Clostridia bacterium]
MIKSMTGYGKGQSIGCGLAVTIEIKTVNHRYLEMNFRLPRSYGAYEDRIKSLLKEKISRGRVDLLFYLEQMEKKASAVKVDKELAMAYYNSLKEIAGKLDLPMNLGVFEISQLPEVIAVEEDETDLEEFWPVVEKAVQEALAGLMKMREEEGRRIQKDLLLRHQSVKEMIAAIEACSGIMVDNYRKRISERIRELFPQLPIDEQRLAMEVALMAEKSDITEELVRLESHLGQMRECLESTEPVGRKLDFLVQEMHREINTIGSKANDLEISQQVVNLKSELEKIREQVQNIE